MSGLSPLVRTMPGAQPTGRLDHPVEALALFYRALNDRDLNTMERSWDHSPDVCSITPLAEVIRGWPEIRREYERLFTGPMRISAEFYDYSIHLTGDLSYAIGRQRGRATVGESTVRRTGRATTLFQRTADGTWKLVHHHLSVDGRIHRWRFSARPRLARS